MPSRIRLAWIKHKSISNNAPLKANNSKEIKSDNKAIASSSVSSSNNNSNQNPAKNPSSTSRNEDTSIQWISLPIVRNSVEIHGFDNEIMSLKKLLGSREGSEMFKAIGVVGMCGVGKTTLCQEFYRRLLAEECLNEMGWSTFSPRVWVSMPKRDNQKEEMVERMLKSLGFEEEKITGIIGGLASSKSSVGKLEVLLYVLRLQLLGKKYLIVLDDVQNSDSSWCKNLSESKPLPSKLDSSTSPEVCLASGLPKKSGGTVIFTCREETTAKKIANGGNLHRVLPLKSDNESLWKIFSGAVELHPKLTIQVLKEKIPDNRDAVKLHPNQNIQFLKEKILDNCEDLKFIGNKERIVEKSLEDKVVSKCKGLPLVAILMAETMPEQVLRMQQKKDNKDMENKFGLGTPKVPNQGPKGETNIDEDQNAKKAKEEALKESKGTEVKGEDHGHGAKVEPSKKDDDQKAKEEKEEAKETEVQGEDHGHDAEVEPPKKDDGQKAKEEKEEANETEVQGEDQGHDSKVEPPKKDDDQKANEEKEEANETEVQGEDHGHDSKVEPPKKDDDQKAKEKEAASKESKEAEVQGEDHGKDAEVEPQKKDDNQKDTETRDHEVTAPKKEAPKEAKETQVHGEDHGHDVESGSPKKDDNQKEMETKDHDVVAPKKQEETLKESKETQVQA